MSHRAISVNLLRRCHRGHSLTASNRSLDLPWFRLISCPVTEGGGNCGFLTSRSRCVLITGDRCYDLSEPSSPAA